MLTKTDLSQIRGVVREEVDIIVEKKLDSKLKPIKKDLRYLKKTVDLVVKNYDEEDVKLGKRVSKIEEHIGLTF